MRHLTLPFSNSQVGGQVNHLKLIKHSMYGRANLESMQQTGPRVA